MSEEIKEKTETKTENKKVKAAGGVMQAAGILVFTSFLSRIIGYIRNIVITSTFDLGYKTDAYYAAFTVPDMIYFLLVGGALSSAFIPVFSSYIAKDEHEDGYKMASTIINIVAIFAAILCLIGVVFAPEVVNFLVQFEGESYLLTVKLTRIMFAQSFFMCITGICHGILQSYKHFASPAFGAVFYNITIIVLGLILAKGFNLDIMGFSIAVVFGAVINLAIQIPAMRRYNFQYKFVLDVKHDGVKQFFTLLLPVLLGLSMNELNLLANQYFGSGLGNSVISALKNAQQIMQLPIGIFAAAIGLSIFPTMTEHFAKDQMDEYKKDLTMSLRTVVFITLPCSLGIIALRVPLVRAMYLQGSFTEANVNQVANLLMFYSIGIIGYSCQQILNRGFYSSKDTKTPVKINIFILLLNILLSFIFSKLLQAPGLALAYATSGTISMIILYVVLHKKVGDFGDSGMVKSFGKSALAGICMFVVLFVLNYFLEGKLPHDRKMYQFIEVLIELAAGIGVYFAIAAALKMEELTSVVSIVKRKIKKK